jgi:MinD-like ATPase involved in chromosome partitioning or flagellar assembly
MYIVTFYSFKGGVGRSLALANVATELAKRGKKVLIVDFDLEAPGLHTFDFGQKEEINGGVVDYVESYLNTNQSPDITKHIVEFKSEYLDKGKLWMMPAGKLDDSYSARLSRLDWNVLYEKKSGYLFFEDLKAQWKEKYNPDYVLIDSRTGHTDVGGICTRQLPNSVVFLFFPNEQNLTGLKKVVQAVDQHNQDTNEELSKVVKHFVSSNVPDLDDENQILGERLKQFSNDLGYKNLTAELHRYNSLSLLEQQIFTLHRPKTQLAREYLCLTNEIILKNYEDIDGVTSYLDSLLKSKNHKEDQDLKDTSERLKIIQGKHENNISILYLISQLKEKYGDLEESLSLVSRAIELGDNKYTTHLRHAKLLISLGQSSEATDSIFRALSSPELSYGDMRLAINLILRVDPSKLTDVVKSEAFKNLETYEFIEIISKYFTADNDRLELATEAIINYNKTLDENDKSRNYLTQHLALLFIAKRDFKNALDMFDCDRPIISNDIAAIFNYAIAEWGAYNKVPNDLFKRIVDIADVKEYEFPDANFLQCMSLSHWASGDTNKALDIAQQIEEVLPQTSDTFSCWTYLNSSSKDFLRDLNEMISEIKDNKVIPYVIKNTHSNV